MTHLNIQQGLNIEVVSTNLIKKLYEAALSVPEPLEGELDAAYMSGNLLVDKSYRSYVEYLTNRFDDLHINVTGGYYIPFHDGAVNNVLKNTIGDGVGVIESQLKAANPKDSELGLANNTDIVDTRELCLIEGTDLTGGFLTGCSNITTIGIPCNVTNIRFNTRSTVNNIVVKDIKNFLNAWIPYNYNFNRNQSGWDLYTTSDGSNILKVETLTIPSGVTFLDNNEYAPLYKCKSVTTLNVSNLCTSLGGCRYSYLLNLTFEPNSILSKICIGAFEYCTNFSLDVSTLPSTITTIKESAFRSCSNITGILNLPNLTSLEESAFYGAGIISIVDLGSITSIPDNCFRGCTGLTSVTLPITVTSIGTYGFADCHMTTMDLSHVTSIGTEAFVNSYLTTADLSNVTSIGSSAFRGSRLTGTLNCPNLVSLGEYAFYGTSGITEINFRNSLVISIPKGVFSGSSAKKIHFPKTVITLQNLWYERMPSLDKFTGLDNIQTHPMIVGIIENGNVKNPIAFKKITGVDQYLVRAANKNNTFVHSLFLPKMQITYSSNEEVLSTPKSTEFTYLSLGLGATSFKLLYYKDIQTFGLGTFYYTNIDNLVINNTTVPTYDTTNLSNFTSGSTLYNNLSSLFGGAINIGTIWVPDSAISTYQASPLFSGMTIKGIDTKTNGTDYDLPRFATLEDWESAAATAEANSQPLPVGLIEEYM